MRKGHWLVEIQGPSVGVVTVGWRGFTLHLGVWKSSGWVWGYEEDWWDGPLPMLGAGPLFLFCWMYSFRESLDSEEWL